MLDTLRSAWRGKTGSMPEVESDLRLAKFTHAAPSPQNAVDIFHGRWASDLAEVTLGVTAGPAGHFLSDVRPRYLLKNFASPAGDLSGQRILELGPLEGGHTYQLEKLGADEIIAVEANAEAYLKCLIIKELTRLKRSTFLYGDFVEFLRETTERFDVIFCCGVLYHSEDPLELIELMAKRTDRAFIWSHYWAPRNGAEPGLELEPATIDRWGEKFVYYRLPYGGREGGRFWGGNKDRASWLRREDIMRALRKQGLVHHEVHDNQPDHPNGPCFSISVWR